MSQMICRTCWYIFSQELNYSNLLVPVIVVELPENSCVLLSWSISMLSLSPTFFIISSYEEIIKMRSIWIKKDTFLVLGFLGSSLLDHLGL